VAPTRLRKVIIGRLARPTALEANGREAGVLMAGMPGEGGGRGWPVLEHWPVNCGWIAGGQQV
jgi:hypothetical protein